jgi:undecaprenyl diphosphate synthase
MVSSKQRDCGTHQDPSPQHVAIIMDGNGRWASERGLPRFAGHEAGAETVKAVVRYASQRKLPYLTLFAFGQENWRRPKSEVHALMHLLSKTLDDDLSFFSQHQVRLLVIGDLSAFSKSLFEKIQHAQQVTSQHNGMTLVLALNYSGRWDITQAFRSLATQVKQGELAPEHISQETIASALVTRDLPDPDLFIRTSGELRISNFMLWQFSYTELFFSLKAWPAFTVDDFKEALLSYGQRQRRFGGLVEPEALL